ncbi:MAG: MATE family efflux transporter [Verrucomicrobiales bacterium]
MQFAAIAMMNYFIGIERPKIGMAAGIAAAAINAALNYCPIFGKNGRPGAGHPRAALSTAISSGILLALMLAAFLRHREAKASGIRAAKPDRAAYQRNLLLGDRMGIYMGVDTLLWGRNAQPAAARALWQSAPLAASTIILSCIHLLQLPIEGIGEGALTCVANAAGQGDATRMRHYADGAVLLAGLYATICGGLLFAFREDVFRLFSDNQAVIDAGSQVILIVALAQFLSAIDTCYCYSLWAIDDTNVPWMFDVFSCLAIFLGGGSHHHPIFPGA